MYARCLRTVAARAHRPARRLLSTAHEELGSASTSAPPAGVSPVTDTNSHLAEPELVKTAEITPNNNGRSLHKNARAATVRVEYGIKSLPIGLAIVQEVERRFGKLRDFKMLPDKDAPGDYLPYLFVEFEDIQSLQYAQTLSHKTIKVTVEPWNREQMVDGGVSLFDVQDYLRRPSPMNLLEDLQAGAETALEANRHIELAEDDGPLEEVEGNSAEAVDEKSEKPRRPVNQINIQVVPLGLESRNQTFDSVNFPRYTHDDTRFLGTRSQTRFAQVFLQWGGFYTGYDFSEAGMEALAWRAHPYGKEPPPSVTAQAQRSGYDLQNAYLDTEVERARTMNRAQTAMKAVMFKRRMLLKDSGAPLEVHGLIFNDAKNRWEVAEPANKPASREVSGRLDVNGAMPDPKVSSTSREGSSLLKALKANMEANKDNAKEPDSGVTTTQLRQSQQHTRKSNATTISGSSTSKASKPASSSSSSPPSTSTPPSPIVQKNAKTKSKQKTASPPPKPATPSPTPQAAVKAQASRSKSQRPAREGLGEQAGNEGFRSKLLGWLKGKW